MCMMILRCLSTHIPTQCRWEGWQVVCQIVWCVAGQVDRQLLSYIPIAVLWSSQHNKNTFHTFIPIITLNCIIQCLSTSVVVHSFTMIHEPSTYPFSCLLCVWRQLPACTSVHILAYTQVGNLSGWVGRQLGRQFRRQTNTQVGECCHTY